MATTNDHCACATMRRLSSFSQSRTKCTDWLEQPIALRQRGIDIAQRAREQFDQPPLVGFQFLLARHRQRRKLVYLQPVQGIGALVGSQQ